MKYVLSAFLAVSAAAHGQVNLNRVVNFKELNGKLHFSKEHLAALQKNQFFACPSADEQLYYVYGRNDYQNIPSLVTSDNVLQLYHVFFDASLRTIETTKLLPDIKHVTKAMLTQSMLRLHDLRGTKLEKAATMNVAYFGVADRLLGGSTTLPDYPAALVAKELANIEAKAGNSSSSVVPVDLDYTQFIVRGHYANSPELSKYFQVMMWYGTTPLPLATKTAGAVQLSPTAVQQALLISRDLKESGALAGWRRIYDLTSEFVGKSNNVTPTQWDNEANQVFASKGDVQQFADKAKLSKFVERISKIQPLITSKREIGTMPDGVQFRFMGQRAVPDTYILQTLSDPKARPFPSPLDVMSVIGSKAATQRLDSFEASKWNKYRSERARLTKEFGAKPTTVWNQDLYYSWLDGYRSLFNGPTGNVPAFMKSSAWADKTLNTVLASWAEMRHDTIVYGLQSAAEMGDGDEPKPVVKGYVEPQPAFYRRMLALVRQTVGALKRGKYLTDEVGSQYASFQELLEFFASVSDRELRGGKITKNEYLRIRHIEGDLEAMNETMLKSTVGYRNLTQDDLDMALLADVHSAYGNALCVGVGRADHLFAIIPVEGKSYLARGTSLSYYEFKRPIAQRPTDKDWKAALAEGKAPARPKWISSFFVPKPVAGKDD